MISTFDENKIKKALHKIVQIHGEEEAKDIRDFLEFCDVVKTHEGKVAKLIEFIESNR